MALEHITDHADRAIAKLPMAVRSRAKLVTQLQVFAEQVQQIEDICWDLLTKRSIAAGEGEQLDVIGRYLGAARNGADDASYRVILAAQIAVLRSSGTAPELLHVFKLLIPDNTIFFSRMGGAGFQLELGAIDTDLLPLYTRFLDEAKGAGINAQAHWSDASLPSDTFTFAPTSSEVSSTHLGFADANSPGTGGHLTGVIV